jgi:MFS family permease
MSNGQGAMRRWFGVAGTFIALFIVTGCLFSFPAFFACLTEELHASVKQLSFTHSTALALYFVFGTVGGYFANERQPRDIVLIGALLMTAGFFVSAAASVFEQIYVGFGVLVGIGLGLAFVPAIAAVLRWFPVQSGLALGLATAGGGVGILILPLATHWCIGAIGCSWTFAALGALSIVGGIVAWLAIGSLPKRQTASVQKGELCAAILSPTFLLIFAAGLFASPGLHIPYVHLVPFAEHAGFGNSAAVRMLLFVGIGNIVGRLLLGFCGDNFGYRNTLAASFLALAAILGWWPAIKTTFQLEAFSFLFGAVYGGAVALTPALIGNYFPLQIAGSLVGFAYLSVALGAFLGPALTAIAFDRFGSFTLPILTSAALALSSAVFVWLTRKPQLG